MKCIGINTLFLIPHEVGGTEYYTRSFISALSKEDKQDDFVLFCNRENADSFVLPSSHWKKVVCPVSARNRIMRILYEQCVFPFMVRAAGCDVLHSFGYLGPILSRAKHVVTVHDVNWLDCPEDVSFFSRLVQGLLTPMCMFFSHKIVTDSDFGKQRLLHYFPYFSSKISVISPWVDETLLKAITVETKKAKEPFILCVSGLYPHKQVPYALELFREVQKHMPEVRFVLVGKNGRDESQIQQQVVQTDHMTYLPTVSVERLGKLYKQASLFLFPSVYEGFGYPVYEASAAGLPILTGKRTLYDSSMRSSLRELTFDLQRDAKLCQKLLTSKRSNGMIKNGSNEHQSISQLRSLYASL